MSGDCRHQSGEMTPRLRYVTKRFNELLQQNALNVLSYSALHAAMKALQNVAAMGVTTGKMVNAADGRWQKYDSFVILLF